MAERMAQSGGLLLGRRTYEDLLSYWNTQESPFKEALNNAPKYVASRTLREPLPWSNSTLLEGNAADAVAVLKQEPGNDLQIMGSGELVQSLMARDPDGGAVASLRLVDGASTTSTGVVIATYQPVRE